MNCTGGASKRSARFVRIICTGARVRVLLAAFDRRLTRERLGLVDKRRVCRLYTSTPFRSVKTAQKSGSHELGLMNLLSRVVIWIEQINNKWTKACNALVHLLFIVQNSVLYTRTVLCTVMLVQLHCNACNDTHCTRAPVQSRVRIFLLFLCIVYFVYFTNYFRVCIFVYLLTINFVRVLIVYFQNIVYSCITINFTVSYAKIAQIYYIPCTCNYRYTFITVLYMNLHIQYLCCLFHILKCEYRYSIICNPWPKFFKGGEKGKTQSLKFC